MDTRDIEKRLKAHGIGRFQVMALLQAVRHYLLYNDLGRAKSFGLNRAIFYAWAKYYGSRQYHRLARVEELLRKQLVRGVKPSKCPENYVEVLGECIRVSPNNYYEIGESEQKPYDFDRQVLFKIKRLIDPGKAWSEAVKYVSSFPEYVLKDPVKFYKYVYEPVRDTFFIQLIEKGYVEAPREIIERLKSLEEMSRKVREKQRNILDYMGGK